MVCSVFLTTEFGGGFPVGWSLIGGLIVGLLLRGWMALTMRGAKAAQQRTEKMSQKTSGTLMAILCAAAGGGAIWMGSNSGIWIITAVGIAALVIGVPFFIWDGFFRSESDEEEE